MRIRRPTSLTGIESQFHKLYKQIADDFGSGRLKWKEFDGSDFQAFRRRYSLTREDLGNLLGVSPVTIIRWETGRLRPSVQAVLAFNYLVHFQGQYCQGCADSTDHLKDIQQATESGKGDVVLPNDFHDHFSPAQIRLLRKTLKLSRMDLSLLIGVTVNAVNKWELGDVSQSEPVNKLLHYLRIYGVESFLRTFHPDKITMSDLNPATLHVLSEPLTASDCV